MEHSSHEELDGALRAIEERFRVLANGAQRQAKSFMGREFAPVQQVAARAELKGPKGLRAGIDLRGDGSAEAWTGRFGRRLVEQEKGEDAYAALRRICPA